MVCERIWWWPYRLYIYRKSEREKAFKNIRVSIVVISVIVLWFSTLYTL